jgi:hypothetical protein
MQKNLCKKKGKRKKKSPAGFSLCNYATWVLQIRGCQFCKGFLGGKNGKKTPNLEWKKKKKKKLKSPELDHSF